MDGITDKSMDNVITTKESLKFVLGLNFHGFYGYPPPPPKKNKQKQTNKQKPVHARTNLSPWNFMMNVEISVHYYG